MSLTLVLGPANSAKAKEVVGRYADAAQRGALLVVPTQADVQHYARELAGQRAVLGSVLTFSGLAREIARRAGFAGRRVSPLQHREKGIAFHRPQQAPFLGQASEPSAGCHPRVAFRADVVIPGVLDRGEVGCIRPGAASDDLVQR